MVPRLAEVEQGKEAGGLAAGGQHTGGAALQPCDLGGHQVAGRVLQTGVEMAAGLQVKQFGHLVRGVVFEGGTLNDGDLTGLAVCGGVAALHADGTQGLLAVCHGRSFLSVKLCPGAARWGGRALGQGGSGKKCIAPIVSAGRTDCKKNRKRSPGEGTPGGDGRTACPATGRAGRDGLDEMCIATMDIGKWSPVVQSAGTVSSPLDLQILQI